MIRVMMTIYEKVERTFGYRQLTLHMRKQTVKTINHKRVERLMNIMGIQYVIRIPLNKAEAWSAYHDTCSGIINNFYFVERS